MTESSGKNFISNGNLLPSEMFSNSMVYEGESIYEVIRMVHGYPVFFDDHFERLVTSTMLRGRRLLADAELLKEDILKLSASEKRKKINLKIVFNYKGGEENYLVYFIEPIYPSDEQYRTGVKGILYHAERENPVSKVVNHTLRSAIYHRLILDGAYEALLVNSNGCITEGSRSNIFFIKDDRLLTAPDNLILSGITRKHIISICHEKNVEVSYSCINSGAISEYQGVFMTGTSPIVLPFRQIDDVIFSVDHPFLGLLRNLYLIKAKESISNFRRF